MTALAKTALILLLTIGVSALVAQVYFTALAFGLEFGALLFLELFIIATIFALYKEVHHGRKK